MKKLSWTSDNYNQVPTRWFYETAERHTAGEINLTENGMFSAGVAIPYQVDEDGNESDWQPLGEFHSLQEAKQAVKNNAFVTVQGEQIHDGTFVNA